MKQAGTRSVPLTLLVLVLVFGAVVAAGIPLLLALSAVAATIGVLALPSHLIPLDSNVDAVVLLVGLAVGVDYTLFYSSANVRSARPDATSGPPSRPRRRRPARGARLRADGHGRHGRDALHGDPTFMGFGLATMAVVAVAMLGSLTVLPALLSKLGDRVEKGRIPFLRRLRRERESRFWNAILTPALRRPALALAASSAVLLALAAPVLHLHTAETGLNSMAKSLPTVDTLQRIEASFPGDPSPAIVAVKADANSPR